MTLPNLSCILYEEKSRSIEKDEPIIMSETTNYSKKTEKGQSFVELMLVLIFMVMFILGIVEFGTLLNEYLNLVDGAREAARIISDYDPEEDPFPAFEEEAIRIATEVMAPLELKQSLGDDIVISYFIVGKEASDPNPHDAFARYPIDPDTLVVFADGYKHMANQDSRFSDADIQALVVDGTTLPRGIFLIEIFYNYPQQLKIPIFSDIVPDPIPVYTYVFMPLPRFKP